MHQVREVLASLSVGRTEGGYRQTNVLVGRSARLRELPSAETLKDPKTRLQEQLQSRGLVLPRYALEEVGGEPHEQWFVASCEAPDLELRATGRGSSRRRAEQEAAQRVLEALGGGQDAQVTEVILVRFGLDASRQSQPARHKSKYPPAERTRQMLCD